MSARDFGEEDYDWGCRDGRSEVRVEILDLCEAIDQQLIGYFAIAERLRAIVGGEDE